MHPRRRCRWIPTWTTQACGRIFTVGSFLRIWRLVLKLQTLPVERGKGMDQPGMRAAEQRLAAGDWVHIFPEGTRSPDGRSLGKLRCGSSTTMPLEIDASLLPCQLLAAAETCYTVVNL